MRYSTYNTKRAEVWKLKHMQSRLALHHNGEFRYERHSSSCLNVSRTSCALVACYNLIPHSMHVPSKNGRCTKRLQSREQRPEGLGSSGRALEFSRGDQTDLHIRLHGRCSPRKKQAGALALTDSVMRPNGLANT